MGARELAAGPPAAATGGGGGGGDAGGGRQQRRREAARAREKAKKAAQRAAVAAQQEVEERREPWGLPESRDDDCRVPGSRTHGAAARTRDRAAERERVLAAEKAARAATVEELKRLFREQLEVFTTTDGVIGSFFWTLRMGSGWDPRPSGGAPHGAQAAGTTAWRSKEGYPFQVWSLLEMARVGVVTRLDADVRGACADER